MLIFSKAKVILHLCICYKNLYEYTFNQLQELSFIELEHSRTVSDIILCHTFRMISILYVMMMWYVDQALFIYGVFLQDYNLNYDMCHNRYTLKQQLTLMASFLQLKDIYSSHLIWL